MSLKWCFHTCGTCLALVCCIMVRSTTSSYVFWRSPVEFRGTSQHLLVSTHSWFSKSRSNGSFRVLMSIESSKSSPRFLSRKAEKWLQVPLEFHHDSLIDLFLDAIIGSNANTVCSKCCKIHFKANGSNQQHDTKSSHNSLKFWSQFLQNVRIKIGRLNLKVVKQKPSTIIF